MFTPPKKESRQGAARATSARSERGSDDEDDEIDEIDEIERRACKRRGVCSKAKQSRTTESVRVLWPGRRETLTRRLNLQRIVMNMKSRNLRRWASLTSAGRWATAETKA